MSPYEFDELSIAAQQAAIKSVRDLIPNKRVAQTDAELVAEIREQQFLFARDGQMIEN